MCCQHEPLGLAQWSPMTNFKLLRIEPVHSSNQFSIRAFNVNSLFHSFYVLLKDFLCSLALYMYIHVYILYKKRHFN